MLAITSSFLYAQPAEFDFPSGCVEATTFDGGVAFGVAAKVEGVDAQVPNDFIAVFNGDGDVVGRAALTSGFFNGSFASTAVLVLRSEAGDNNCPTFMDAPSLTVRLYDASADEVLLAPNSMFQALIDGGEMAGPDGSGATDDLFDFLANALPVSLTNFAATPNGTEVKLNWSTSTETDNDYFEVQRSASPDAGFVNIGKVLGSETTSSRSEYEFTDNSPATGTNYYRLQQFDLNGDTEFSPILVVEMEATDARAVAVFPNPTEAGGRMTLRLDGEWTNATVKMVDATGREVANWNNLRNGSLNTELPVVKAGVYQLIATDGKEQRTTRVVIR